MVSRHVRLLRFFPPLARVPALGGDSTTAPEPGQAELMVDSVRGSVSIQLGAGKATHVAAERLTVAAIPPQQEQLVSVNAENKYDISPYVAEIYDQEEEGPGDIALIKKLIGKRGPLRILEPFCGHNAEVASCCSKGYGQVDP